MLRLSWAAADIHPQSYAAAPVTPRQPMFTKRGEAVQIIGQHACKISRPYLFPRWEIRNHTKKQTHVKPSILPYCGVIKSKRIKVLQCTITDTFSFHLIRLVYQSYSRLGQFHERESSQITEGQMPPRHPNNSVKIVKAKSIRVNNCSNIQIKPL